MPVELKEFESAKVVNFKYKVRDKKYLVTNDLGDYCFLDRDVFESLVAHDFKKPDSLKFKELKENNFIITGPTDLKRQSQRYAFRKSFLFEGPSLHIMVLTLRCDHACIYCQTSSKTSKRKSWDMDKATAKKIVDTIFKTPNNNIIIEFQGGEPLLNFSTLEFIVDYARKENKKFNKNLKISLVSNFAQMDEIKLDFLLKNKVSVCTSLDGPEKLHNQNRICTIKGFNTYQNTIRWIKVINKKRENGEYQYKINALSTITKHSLNFAIEIVDEFIKLHLDGVFLRPVNPFGISRKNAWNSLGITPEAFIDFYREALDYIIELNKEGKPFFERTAQIFLAKILSGADPNHLDIRSPCGAGIGQLAYNFNGDVYTCDEGRMFSAGFKDESFRLGNVFKNSYPELVDNERVKAFCFASCLDNIPGCCDCVYKPYCGVCPIYNYALEGSLFSKSSCNFRCQIHSAILDYLFDKLQTSEREILKQWVLPEKGG